MIIRKLIAAIVTCGLMMTLAYFGEDLPFSIFLGMYLLPILVIYGIPSSFFSDWATRRVKGWSRGVLAFLIHLTFALLFVLVPSFMIGGLDELIAIVKYWYTHFFVIMSLLSSSLFWGVDELLKLERLRVRCNGVLQRIGELRI
jgi:hypothetical protein